MARGSDGSSILHASAYLGFPNDGHAGLETLVAALTMLESDPSPRLTLGVMILVDNCVFDAVSRPTQERITDSYLARINRCLLKLQIGHRWTLSFGAVDVDEPDYLRALNAAREIADTSADPTNPAEGALTLPWRLGQGAHSSTDTDLSIKLSDPDRFFVVAVGNEPITRPSNDNVEDLSDKALKGSSTCNQDRFQMADVCPDLH